MALSGDLAPRQFRVTGLVDRDHRLTVRPGSLALIGTVATWTGVHLWLAAKAADRISADGGDPSMTLGVLASPLLTLGAWTLAVAVTRKAIGARWPRLGTAAVAVLLGLAIVLNQLPADQRPWWYPDVAPTPLAGMPWVPSSPPLIVLWRLGWLALDLTLVLVFAKRLRLRTSAAASRPTVRHLAVVVAVQAAAILALGYTTPLIDDQPATLARAGSFVADVAPVLVLGLCIAIVGGRGWRLPAALASAVGLDALAGLAAPDAYSGYGTAGYRLVGGGPDDPWNGVDFSTRAGLLRGLVTVAMLAVLTAGPAFGRALSKLERRALTALQIGLVLNTVDAVATWLGIRGGAVEEGNPLVRQGGLGLKWVFVTVLLLALWRIRPTLLWIVVAAYTAVVAYHLLGATVLA